MEIETPLHNFDLQCGLQSDACIQLQCKRKQDENYLTQAFFLAFLCHQCLSFCEFLCVQYDSDYDNT